MHLAYIAASILFARLTLASRTPPLVFLTCPEYAETDEGTSCEDTNCWCPLHLGGEFAQPECPDPVCNILCRCRYVDDLNEPVPDNSDSEDSSSVDEPISSIIEADMTATETWDCDATSIDIPEGKARMIRNRRT